MTDIFACVISFLCSLICFWIGMFVEWVRYTRRLNKGPYDGVLLFGEDKACLSLNIDLDELKKCGHFIIKAQYTKGEVIVDDGETTKKDLIHM